VVGLLPWLLNGSLEEGEKVSILSHLSSCSACRTELAACKAAFELLDQHVPSRELAEYELGMLPRFVDHGSIERHLGICRSCRTELEEIRAAENWVELESAAPPASQIKLPGWAWGTAVAASLAAFLIVGSWVFVVGRSQETVQGVTEPGQVLELDLFSDGFESGSAEDWEALGSGGPTAENLDG